MKASLGRAVLHSAALFFAGLATAWLPSNAWAACPPAEQLGGAPGERLVVVVPAVGQGRAQWTSFLEALKREPGSKSMDWLFIHHRIGFTTRGSAASHAENVASCINEKNNASKYKSITLVGHSVGGMLVRSAYLLSAGAYPGQVRAEGAWVEKVDRILLFASVNRGVAPKEWWMRTGSWFIRHLPLLPHYVVQDLLLGSDFVADLRIAWIRYFDELNSPGARHAAPRIVQFWGTQDSLVTADDNADLEAFSGDPVLVRIPGATHGHLQRLEAQYAEDPAARWAQYRNELLDDAKPLAAPRTHQPRQVLFVTRGIRDTANSEWVQTLRDRAAGTYESVELIDYGYFSAAHFLLKPIRARLIPDFRDRYTEYLARNHFRLHRPQQRHLHLGPQPAFRSVDPLPPRGARCTGAADRL
jgi:hypothetical protein